MATARRYSEEETPDSASGRFVIITPNDTNELTYITRQVDVGGHGAMTVVTEHGETVVLPDMGQPWSFPVRVRIIKSTGTTATLIVAYF